MYNQIKAPILHLNLTHQWFDMILSGEKLEEYREIKPFWNRIFETGNIKLRGIYYQPSDVIICFSNGYSKNRSQFYCRCLALEVKHGIREWGASPHQNYYTLLLGEPQKQLGILQK